jgi:hypothetical protein
VLYSTSENISNSKTTTDFKNSNNKSRRSLWEASCSIKQNCRKEKMAAHVCRCSLPGGGQVGGWRARTRHAAGDTGAAAARRRAPGPNRPRRSLAHRRSRPAAWRLLGPRAPASGATGSGEPATVNDDRKGRAAAGPRGPPIRPTASGTPSLMGPARQLPRRTTWRACLPD